VRRAPNPKIEQRAGRSSTVPSRRDEASSDPTRDARHPTPDAAMEQTLRETEILYRTLFENAGDAIVMLEQDVFVRCNQKALRLFGCTEAQLIGQTPHRFSPLFQEDGAESKDKALEKIASALDGEAQSFEWLHQRYDGTPFDAEVSLNAVRTSRGVVVQAIVRDVTARKRAERELQRALQDLSLARDELQDENKNLREALRGRGGAQRMFGESPELRGLLRLVEQVATTDSTVLMLGETGTGKELLANELHGRSHRRGRPMVRVNCAALPSALIESELFGHERGAFTGATSRRVGRFELASGSTIFLDEIGELPLEIQAKLLRVLQEREIERVGDPKPIRVNVRILAATNRDLAREVREGRFRDDLYYRLNVFPLYVPPLRARVSDVPILVQEFVAEFSQTMGKRVEWIHEADLAALMAYPWPGNVRELRNTVERAMITASGSILRIRAPARASALDGERGAPPARVAQAVSEAEQLRATLERCGWRIRGEGGAAAALGLKPTTLESRLHRFGVHRPGRASR
jgi:PAS domain S-box-containing protein